MFYFDWTYLLVIAGFVICLIFSGIMKSTFNKYSKVAASSGYTGRDTAARILTENGLGTIPIGIIAGSMTDHYDPSKKQLALSETVYDKRSIAAIGVAAHECGHAIQDATGFAPLAIRSAMVPMVNICSRFAWILIIIGLLITGSSSLARRFGSNGAADTILTIGIIMFAATVVFQLVTLPVEIDASRRGLAMISRTGILNEEEMKGAKKVLTAAAFTYIAATLSAILSLIRIILLTNRRR